MALYQSLAAMFQADFQSAVARLKQYLNIEAGWGEVQSDQANFPVW
jgi:hypothetical protein